VHEIAFGLVRDHLEETGQVLAFRREFDDRPGGDIAHRNAQGEPRALRDARGLASRARFG
jgi:hypothetical protein